MAQRMGQPSRWVDAWLGLSLLGLRHWVTHCHPATTSPLHACCWRIIWPRHNAHPSPACPQGLLQAFKAKGQLKASQIPSNHKTNSGSYHAAFLNQKGTYVIFDKFVDATTSPPTRYCQDANAYVQITVV